MHGKLLTSNARSKKEVTVRVAKKKKKKKKKTREHYWVWETKGNLSLNWAQSSLRNSP